MFTVGALHVQRPFDTRSHCSRLVLRWRRFGSEAVVWRLDMVVVVAHYDNGKSSDKRVRIGGVKGARVGIKRRENKRKRKKDSVDKGALLFSADYSLIGLWLFVRFLSFSGKLANASKMSIGGKRKSQSQKRVTGLRQENSSESRDYWWWWIAPPCPCSGRWTRSRLKIQ